MKQFAKHQNKKMFQKLDIALKSIKKEALRTQCKSAIIINVTTQKFTEDLLILPTRYLKEYVCLPIGIKDDHIGIRLGNYIDGKIDTIFVDAENKLVRCKNIFDKISCIIKKSKVYAIKGNDIAADATFSVVCTIMKPITNKKICIIGSGNIGSKVALKMVECGAKIFILNSNKKSSEDTAHAINILKPRECKDTANPVNKKNIPHEIDGIIGFTRGIPVITKEMISLLKNDGFVLDGGSGTITPEGIEEANRRKITILRLDVRMGFISHANLMLNTENLISNIFGTTKINGINIVAGGAIGNKGDIIVDNIKKPRKILGIADGKGKTLRNIKKYRNDIKIVSRKIN